jgi:hypothetical protein
MMLDTTINEDKSDHMKIKRIFFHKAVLSNNSIVELTIWGSNPRQQKSQSALQLEL